MVMRILGAIFLMMHMSAVDGVAEPVVSDLQGQYRNGQVFLTWDEAESPAGTAFNVYASAAPIASRNLRGAVKIGHHVERHSARDWWQNPASFFADAEPGAPAGLVVEDGAAPLSPSGGLFVHTVTSEDAGPRYYAVTVVGTDGTEDTMLTPGDSTLRHPVHGEVAPVWPVYIGASGSGYAQGEAEGRPLIFGLSGRGSGYTAGGERPQKVNYMFFGDARQGWRAGLPFKFLVQITDAAVRVTPCARQWTGGRPLLESRDKRDHCPAINTWYYGYPERIYETLSYENKVIPNFTEEQILGIVRWAQDYLGADLDRSYLSGGSMGGSGSVSLGFHHPHIFTHIDVRVPAVAYTPEGNLHRLECFCGSLDETAVNHKGEPFLAHMNGILTAQHSRVDLPFLVMRSGRTDKSIPWANKPAFYRAMNTARQGFVAYWSNGGHADADRDFPGNSHYAPAREKFGLDLSYLAFSNASHNSDPGNGDPEDGDPVGWINRGLDWEGIEDMPDGYAVTVLAYSEGLAYPVTVDVTLRRLQRFKVEAGEEVTVRVDGGDAEIVRADDSGLITVREVRIADRKGTRIRVQRR